MFGWISRRWKHEQHKNRDIGDRNNPESQSYEQPPALIHASQANTEETEYRKHDRQYKDRQILTNYLVAAFTAMTAGVGIWQGIQTRHALESADRQAKASEESNRVARESIVANLAQNQRILQSSATEIQQLTSNAAEANRKGIEASTAQNRSLIAASIAQSRDALNASIDASRTDQRAWVGGGSPRIAAEPEIQTALKCFLDVKNVGKTPALNLRLKTITGFFLSADIYPGPPDWTAIKNTPSPAIEFPGESAVNVPIIFPEMTSRPVSFYRAHLSKLFVCYRFDYQDIFARSHFTESCFSHEFGANTAEGWGESKSNAQ